MHFWEKRDKQGKYHGADSNKHTLYMNEIGGAWAIITFIWMKTTSCFCELEFKWKKTYGRWL